MFIMNLTDEGCTHWL